jgi:membrane protease YdiL (CAAX protease family)
MGPLPEYLMALATLFGVAIALLGPALPVDRLFAFRSPLARHLFSQAYLLSLVGVILVLVHVEDATVASLGWQGASISSVLWGLVLAAGLMWLVYPVTLVLFRAMRITGYTEGLGKLAALPRWSLILAAVVAGIAEETLYRGFALTRIADLTGSSVLAILLTTLIFAVVHQRLWGWGASVGFVVSGLVLSAFFVWRQDLLANILAHALTDAIGLIRLTKSTPRLTT